MTGTLEERVATALDAPVAPEVADIAAELGREAGALAVLFYGSNLRTGSLDGVLDFYVLLPGPQREKIWPLVSYREWPRGGLTLRAKIATMALDTFERAARGERVPLAVPGRPQDRPDDCQYPGLCQSLYSVDNPTRSRVADPKN